MWINCLGIVFFQLVISVLYTYSDMTKHENYNLLEQGTDCGVSVSNRIFGGDDAEMGQYPWMALLALNESEDNSLTYICGGAVISKRYVLTAAHCVMHDTDALILLLGEYKLDEDPDCIDVYCASPVQKIKIQETLSHDYYDNDADASSPYDIALIRTAAEIHFNGFVQPICLPVHEFTLSDNKAEVVGWGSNSKYGFLRKTPILQRLFVKILHSRECSWNLQFGQLCVTGGPSKDTCNGDSGGPLMKVLSHPIHLVPRYFLIGVLSNGAQMCAFSKTPMSVFTNVTTYTKWILDNIKP